MITRRGRLLWTFSTLLVVSILVWLMFFAHPTYGQCHESDIGTVCKLLHY